MVEEFLSFSAEETRQYARRFASGLQTGDIISLCGELGSGKTEFMRGITGFFNCDEQLSSPTFTLFNIYQGSLRNKSVTLHHFDLYRIQSLHELEMIGFEEYLSTGFLSVVEWANLFPEYGSFYTAKVFLAHAGNESRTIIIERKH
ncbi:MAG: tRNA (adenosine(37)-N6)-threonylcarbamoyltransferase complex ATPase subunit type 1 TsaE [Chlorobiaceae bacterium]